MKNQLKLFEYNTVFLPKPWSVIVYLILFVIVLFLFFGRNIESIKIKALLNYFPDLYSHISNFSISFLLCLISGYMNIMKSGKLRDTWLFIVLLIAANFIYELFIPILNTPDVVDAFYGLIGTLMPLFYLYFYKNYGLMKNPKYQPQDLDK
ncbi:MAG: hypothetical protein R2739_09290 [Chitinophagales bacterium]|nr:hypothetical protein [Bacteroidota bacterium]